MVDKWLERQEQVNYMCVQLMSTQSNLYACMSTSLGVAYGKTVMMC